MTERLDILLAELAQIGLEPLPMELAEMLWLAAHISAAPRQTNPAAVQQEAAPEAEQAAAPSQQPPAEPRPKIPKTQPQQAAAPAQTALYPSVPGTDGAAARPIRSPAVPSLPNALGLGRALRPLHRKMASRTRRCLDEAATAERYAEQILAGQTLLIPALQPARERWFELALVIDQGDSMRIWQPLLADLRRLLAYQGAFRALRLWHLHSNGNEALLRVGADPQPARLCKPQELRASGGRRLVLVVSDCISRAWHTGAVGALLQPLCASAPLALLQLLPQRMWRGSALGRGTEIRVAAASPGAVAAKLPLWGVSPEAAEIMAEQAAAKPWQLPVLTLESDVLSAWAHLLNGRPGIWIYAVRFDAQTRYASGDQVPPSTPDPASIAKRLQRFFADASPTAQQLAGYFAAAPLTLPVMRLVQQALLPQSGQAELAEVFVSGLLRKLHDGETPGDAALYDFHDGIRDRLLQPVGNSEAVKVLCRVSDFVASRTGRCLDFHALLADPTADGDLVLDADARHFASVGAKVLRRFGGEYLRLAERLEGGGSHWGAGATGNCQPNSRARRKHGSQG